jgi:hypothetical protein
MARWEGRDHLIATFTYGLVGAVAGTFALAPLIEKENESGVGAIPTTVALGGVGLGNTITIAGMSCSTDEKPVPIIVSPRFGTRGLYDSIRAMDPAAVIPDMTADESDAFMRSLLPAGSEADTHAEFDDLPASITSVDTPITCTSPDGGWNLNRNAG